MRTYAAETIDPQLSEDKRNLWSKEVSYVQDLHDWMTLMAPDDLKHWSKVLLQDMECDERSSQAFVTLFRKGKRGYAETCGVLAHLLKDKDLDPQKPRSNRSQWLKRTSEEASDAIDHPEVWECGLAMGQGPAKGTRGVA